MEWKNVLSSVSPYLGAAVGGPLGGVAVAAIASALGLSDKTEETIKDALRGATPEQVHSLKMAEQEFALKVQELGFANEQALAALSVQDRDSARKRETEVRDTTPRNLAYSITAGFFGVLLFIMFAEVHAAMKEVLYMMLGALGASWQACISYYFGSTTGSKLKSELLVKKQ